MQGGVSTLTCGRYPEWGKSQLPWVWGLHLSLLSYQHSLPTSGAKLALALYTGGLHLLWAESSTDPLIGQILLRPTSHPSHLTPAGLVLRIPHLGSGVCDPPILLLGALPQPPPLFHAPVKND